MAKPTIANRNCRACSIHKEQERESLKSCGCRPAKPLQLNLVVFQCPDKMTTDQKKGKIEHGNVQMTLPIPLWGRAKEYEKGNLIGAFNARIINAEKLGTLQNGLAG